MKTHAPSSRSQNQPSLPNQSFFSWLRAHTTLFISQIIGLLGGLSVPIALIYYSIHADLPVSIGWETVGHFVVYAHLFFLILFIAVLIRMSARNNIGAYRARLVHNKLKGRETNLNETEASRTEQDQLEAFSTRQVARFKHRFLAFWCAMLFLYSIFAVEPLFSVAPDDCLQALSRMQIVRSELFPLLSFAMNNLSLIFIFCCFSVLYLPLRATSVRSEAWLPMSTGENVVTLSEVGQANGIASLLLGLLRRIAKRLRGEHLNELERRQRRLVARFVIAMVLFTVTFPLIMLFKKGVPTNWSEYPAIFDALSGTINAVVLALLVARLDSKLIGLPSWLICILYFYAGVQPLFVVFELHPDVYAGIKAAVLLVVFIFKIYFFLIIVFSLQTGRMFNYFFCSPILNQHVKELTEAQKKLRVDADREDAREIWFKGLGFAAILIFGGSLLLYESLSDEHKHWFDSDRFSNDVVKLHVLLLAIILVVIYFKAFVHWFRENQGGCLDELKFLAPSALINKLSEPMSPEDRDLKNKNLSDRTKSQFKSFTSYFRLFWISLLCLYIAMGFSVIGQDRRIQPTELCPTKAEQLQLTNETKDAGEPLEKEDSFSLAAPESKLFFSQHDQKEQAHEGGHTEQTSGPQADDLLSVSDMMQKTKYAFIFFVVNNLTVMVLFWCFTVLYIPNDDEKFDEKDRLLRKYSLLICGLLTVVLPLLAIILKSNGFSHSDVNRIPTILGAVGGTLNAVAFALLIARLDSRIIQMRSLLITVLYVYAALQPLFVTFNQPSQLLKFIATSAMIAAFIFKICLVLMVGVVRNSGGLINYLWFFPLLNNRVNSVFGNQFEIKIYSPKSGFFTFSISNNNVEMYQAADVWDSRDKCDQEIRLMVKAMEDKNNYLKPPELQGTHWIQVKSKCHLFCESIALRSESEVYELIKESVEKVPYCKYNRG